MLTFSGEGASTEELLTFHRRGFGLGGRLRPFEERDLSASALRPSVEMTR